MRPFAVDPSRCLARVWNAGEGRQCKGQPLGSGGVYCGRHAKNLPHGTVVGEVEPTIQAKFARAQQRKTFGEREKRWYSRLKLWDEARTLGKLPADFTDEEFERALWNIHRYFAVNPAVVHGWRLQPYRGPQTADDRHDATKVDYLGEPRRFMYYSALLFREELEALRPGATLADVSEPDFMEVLKRTSARAANNGMVRNYFTGAQRSSVLHATAR